MNSMQTKGYYPQQASDTRFIDYEERQLIIRTLMRQRLFRKAAVTMILVIPPAIAGLLFLL